MLIAKVISGIYGRSRGEVYHIWENIEVEDSETDLGFMNLFGLEFVTIEQAGEILGLSKFDVKKLARSLVMRRRKTMKRIIKGKSYDTETATLVGSWDNGSYVNDFCFCAESLYRKRTGEYFLHGEGGARSPYVSYRGSGNWGYGEKIMPVAVQAAKRWAEKHLSGEAYEREFGEVAEDETRAAVSVTLPAHIVAELRKRAAEQGKSLSAVVEEAIRL